MFFSSDPGSDCSQRHHLEAQADDGADAKLAGEPAEDIGKQQQRLARRNHQPAGLLAHPAFNHQQWPIDKKGHPETGPAKGRHPRKPQAGLADVAHDIGQRVEPQQVA